MAPDDETRITGEISNGKPSLPPTLPVLPPFEVKSMVVFEMEVVEPPPLSGLPPVAGTITTTVRLVEDPKLPDPPPPPVPADDPPMKVGFARPDRHSQRTRLASVSATVYDHSRTLLRFRSDGNLTEEVTVWSNLDFNHFCGFSTFEVKDAAGGVRRYSLQMGLGNEDTVKRAVLMAKHGVEYVPPEFPLLPADKPAYVIQGAAPDEGAVQLVEDLHELYRAEGARMKAAYQARIRAEAEQRAYYLANPPIPGDVTLSFWEREHPVGMSADTIKEEEGN